MLTWLEILFGPMFAKEMVELSRRPKYFLNRLLLVGILFVVFVIFWREYSVQAHFGYRPNFLISQFATGLFESVLWTEFLAILVLTPFFVFSVIAAEREQGTLDLVLTTDLLDREVIFGKLLSRLCVMSFLVLGGMPVLAIAGLLGGIHYPTLFRAVLIMLSSMLFVGSLTLFFSTISRSPLGALVRSFTWLLLLFAGLPVLAGITIDALKLRPSDAFSQIFYGQVLFNPFFAFLATMVGRIGGEFSRSLGPSYFSLTFYLPVTLSALFIYLSIRRLRPRDPVVSTKGLAAAGRNGQSKPAKQIRSRRGLPKKPHTIFRWPIENPVWLRHRLALPYDRDAYIYRLQRLAIFFAVLVVVVLLCGGKIKNTNYELPMVFLAIGLALSLLLLLLIAGLSFNTDRRRGTLDMTLQTALTPREILDGTFLGVLQYVFPIHFTILLICFAAILFGFFSVAATFLSIITAGCFLALCTFTAMGSSLMAKSPLSAMIAAFVLPVISVFGLPLANSVTEDQLGICFLVGAPLLTMVFAVFYRRQRQPWLFAALVTSIYFSISAYSLVWAFPQKSDQRYGHPTHPMEIMHVAYLTFSIFDQDRYSRNPIRYGNSNDLAAPAPIIDPERWFHGSGPWQLIHPMTWFAILLTLWIARRILERDFDRICERPEPRDIYLPS